ncbi:hypothetical protein J3B02_005452 [Coemansia erecta]|uniref:Uncharacterized protein n=1 Tax=Coemansia asiatica TaxID=1052880 RepID=A0A9W8CIT1_9FUNG|nr:hypothetical protein LPJ64_003402 [Coemansia asiatica]KAJ2842851.1 hypothetical protein J3B02_005452 [Coemansia erecta]KAJ2875908.1 hypothetical protein FB639_003950 [Coemansia asiatica]
MISLAFSSAAAAAARTAGLSRGSRRMLRILAPPAICAAKQTRSYTNTSVYTRMDGMTHDEYVKLLLEEQRYLMDLLKTDDSQAPWRKENIETVSREVQEGLHEPNQWMPEEALHH